MIQAIYNLHWNMIDKSTGVTLNMGLYKLNWLPGHPNLNVNLINYNCIATATAVAMQSWMKFF